MEVTYTVLQTAVVQRSVLELEQELHNEPLSAQHSQLFSQIYQHWTKTFLSHAPGAIHTDAGLCSRDVRIPLSPVRGYFAHMAVEVALQAQTGILFWASAAIDDVSHLIAAAGKAFAGLHCHLSDDLCRRKLLPKQQRTSFLSISPLKGVSSRPCHW